MALVPSAIDTTGIHGTTTSVSPINYTGLTTVSGDTDLVVFLVENGTPLLASLVLNWDSAGTPQLMTLVGSATNAGGDSAAIYWLANPNIGNLNLQMSFTGTLPAWNLSAMSFKGGGGGTSSPTSGSGGTTPATVTVTSAAGHFTMWTAACNSGTFNAPAGCTQLVRNSSAESIVAGYQTGSASNTMSATYGGASTWAAFGFDLLPPQAAPPTLQAQVCF